MGFKKMISISVFWGAVWGMIEVTLGTLLHAANINLGWLFWFPAAFYFMNRVYRQTGKAGSILLLSVVAASIKLIDLALPVRIDKVINPAVSILLEGLMVFITFWVLEKYGSLFQHKLPEIAVISFSWRILYAAYVIFLPSWMVAISPVRGLFPFLKFLLLEGTVNTLAIWIAMKLYLEAKKFYKDREMDYLPLSAFGLLIIALFVQWVL